MKSWQNDLKQSNTPAGIYSMKKAILLAAHGSKNCSSNSALGNILKMAKAEYPDVPVERAFTSGHVLKKLREQGLMLPTIKETLESMYKNGITHVVIQSLHVIPGTEFMSILRTIKKIEHTDINFTRAILGHPLLNNEQEVDEVSDMILSFIPERDPRKDGLILAAHGSRYSENGTTLYNKLKSTLKMKDANAYLCKLNLQDDIVNIGREIKKSGIERTFMVPLLFGAGNHVQRDMAGEHKHSWKNIVSACGTEVIPIVKGIGELDIFAARWMDNLRRAMIELEE